MSHLLVVGLGPVGLAALMLCKAMGANRLFGVDMNEGRIVVQQEIGHNVLAAVTDSLA